MGQTTQRAFALSGAILFFITASALTIAIIASAVQSKHKDSNTTANSTSQSQACDIQTPVDAATETVPEAYKPPAAVTDLKTTDITVGSGKTVKKGDCLVMKYVGNVASDGSVFDENYDKPQALQFHLGGGEVIQGWDQGLIGMKVGGVRRIEIPSALGYGSSEVSSIPANSDLVFTVKLLKIK